MQEQRLARALDEAPARNRSSPLLVGATLRARSRQCGSCKLPCATRAVHDLDPNDPVTDPTAPSLPEPANTLHNSHTSDRSPNDREPSRCSDHREQATRHRGESRACGRQEKCPRRARSTEALVRESRKDTL